MFQDSVNRDVHFNLKKLDHKWIDSKDRLYLKDIWNRPIIIQCFYLEGEKEKNENVLERFLSFFVKIQWIIIQIT